MSSLVGTSFFVRSGFPYELTTVLAVVHGFARILQSAKMDAYREKQANIYPRHAQSLKANPSTMWEYRSR